MPETTTGTVAKKAAAPSVTKKEVSTVKNTKGYTSTKKVYIVPVASFHTLPRELQDETIKKIGSFFKRNINGDPTRNIFIPLSEEEIRTYARELFGLSPESDRLGETVEKYFLDYTIKLPMEKNDKGNIDGKLLEVPLNEEGEVIMHKDFVRDVIEYRICQAHPRVATTDDEISRANSSEFIAFLRDPDRDKSRKIRLATQKLEADKLYIKLASGDNMDKVDWILDIAKKGVVSNSGVDSKPEALRDVTNIDILTKEEKQWALNDLKENFTASFMSIATDDHLEQRAYLSTAVAAGVVTLEGSTYLFDDELMGVNEREAIAWLDNPKNSKSVLILKQKLKAAK